MRTKESDVFSGISLRDLQAFLAIAESLNTTVAAERLGVTQSAVSQSLARLERWLGVQLLDRSRRPIRLTRSGETLRLGASNILQGVRQTVEEVRAGQQGEVPLLRLGLIDSFATTVGPDVVKSLTDRVGHLQVWSGITPTLTAALLNRSVDVVVCNDPLAEHAELSRDCLLQEPLVMVVPREWAERARAMPLEAMCADMPFVRFSARSALGQAVEYFLAQRRLSPKRNLEFDASEAVLRMVSGGLGWTITTPACLLQAHSRTLDITVLPLPGPQSQRRVYLVYRRNELALIMPDIIGIFRDCVQRTILPAARQLAPWMAHDAVPEADA